MASPDYYKSHSSPRVPMQLVLFFLVINITPSLAQDTQQLIDHICRQMEEFGFCGQTFKENLKSPNADIVALTQITIERATDNATKTHDFIRQVLGNTNDPALKMPSQNDYDSVQRYETVTPRAEASCEDSLSTPPNTQNPLTNKNRQMRILIAMALVSLHDLMATQHN
ncbi:unnamed protein product [Prunus armeniaca]|uniref:Pectinesterase inhibitor domain-containing protein n=1 Tax=Prunus armeniaca TaxID=36596 RepID=A0A6J5XRK3_PRUAR|nr:unnamed protein product [Prunus armeniaca]